jgi:hypothetical protein
MVNANARNNRESLGPYRGMDLKQLAEPRMAQKLLARLLRRGELVLFLGAGVSSASKLPTWEKLVERCEVEVGLPSPKSRSTAELMDAMEQVNDKVDDAAKFRELVRRNLYPDVMLSAGTYPDSILQQELLIALGALVMPSRRGAVRDVITLNFDDLLEWYLRLHGFTTQSVPDFPVYLRSDIDVVVYHPHGFLPLDGDPTDWLVLTHQEFIKRIAKTDGQPWRELMVNTFLTKRVLAIGTSMNDLDMGIYVEEAHGGSNDRTPAGFVVTLKLPDAKRKQLLKSGMVPIELGDYGEIPGFLLGICREAARLHAGG